MAVAAILNFTGNSYARKVYIKYTSICIAHFTRSASNALRHGSHSFTCKYTMPAFTVQPQNITARWLVLILPSYGG